MSRRQLLFGKFGAQSAGNLTGIPDSLLHGGAMRPVFAENCLPGEGVVCRSCGEACESAAISFRPAPRGVSLPVLNSENCTGCGDCVAVCPIGALSLRTVELPEELPA